MKAVSKSPRLAYGRRLYGRDRLPAIWYSWRCSDFRNSQNTEHLQYSLIKMTKRIAVLPLAFDGDAAGQKPLRRTLGNCPTPLLNDGRELKILCTYQMITTQIH